MDVLIFIVYLSSQRLHEENEKLFDRLTEKASLASSPQVPLFGGTSVDKKKLHYILNLHMLNGTKTIMVA